MTKNDRKIVLGIAKSAGVMTGILTELVRAMPADSHRQEQLAAVGEAMSHLEEVIQLMNREWTK